MRTSDNYRTWDSIEGPERGITIPFLKDILRQEKLYVIPLQCDIPEDVLKALNREAREVLQYLYRDGDYVSLEQDGIDAVLHGAASTSLTLICTLPVNNFWRKLWLVYWYWVRQLYMIYCRLRGLSRTLQHGINCTHQKSPGFSPALLLSHSLIG